MSIHQELLRRLNPEARAERVVIGAFITAVVSGGSCGLSTTLRPKSSPHMGPVVRRAGELEGRTLVEMGELVFSKNPTEASLGMASINAGIRSPELETTDMNGMDLLRDKAEDANLVVVGHFSFIHKLSPITRSTVVLELDPLEGDTPADQADKVIPGADVVAITGSAFSNRTVEGLLELAKRKWVMVLGPTTPLTPLLFDYGVDAIAASEVTDVDLTLSQASQGAIFKQLTGARRVLAIKP